MKRLLALYWLMLVLPVFGALTVNVGSINLVPTSIPIAFDAGSSNGTFSVSQTSFTNALTIAQMTNGYVVVGFAHYPGSAPITSISFAGTNMSAIKTNISANSVASGLYGLAVGSIAAGTYNVIITWSSAAQEFVLGASSWHNVHQSSPLGTAATATGGSSTTPTVNVSSATGEVVVDMLEVDNGVTMTVGAGQTQRWQFRQASHTSGGCSSEAGAATVTMSWTLGSTDFWAITGVSLKPAFP